MKLHHLPLLILFLTLAGKARADVPADAARDIDGANRDWSVAVVQGDVKREADAYAANAVFCDAQGLCTTGHDRIQQMMAQRLLQGGSPKSADAHSLRRLEDRGLVYEWGEAKLLTAQGDARGGRYFTIWQRQPDGHWKIIRNLVLP